MNPLPKVCHRRSRSHLRWSESPSRLAPWFRQ
jgi:hypothetical protein